MPKVSIIMPFYNVEKYIEQCITSLLKQSYSDFELICVDDGSKDDSIKIVEKYGKIDNRIKIIRQENKGLATARNTGLKVATGEFIYFVDSDDWVHPDLLKETLTRIELDNSDIVIFDTYNVYGNSFVPVNRIANFKDKFKKEYLYYKDDIDCIDLPCTAWSKLYRAEFIQKYNLQFPNGMRFGEDSPLWFLLLQNNPKISLLDKCLYFYRKRQDSLTARSTDLMDKQIHVYNFVKNMEYFSKFTEEEQLRILDFNCRMCIYAYSAMENIKLSVPYEKSLKYFFKEYKYFKNYNLWALKGYRLLKFRFIYTLGKKIVLKILKLKTARKE